MNLRQKQCITVVQVIPILTFMIFLPVICFVSQQSNHFIFFLVTAATDDNSEFLQLNFSDTYKGNSSSELQIWDILDLYFPESFAAVQFNTLMGFRNDGCIPYNECMDDIIQMSITPSPDKTSNMDDATCGVPVDYTSFYLQNKPSDSDNECSSASSSATGYECTDNQELPVGLLNLMDISSQGDSDELSRPSLNTKNIVLVLDLDGKLTYHSANL
jgi:CTD small phosphatase-like protein 2